MENVHWLNKEQTIRFKVLPDEVSTFDDCYGDCFNPECNPALSKEVLLDQERRTKERFYPEIMQVEIKCPLCGTWEYVESISGMCEYDWSKVECNPYFRDLLDEAECKLAILNVRLK